MRRSKEILDDHGQATVLYAERKPMPQPDRFEKARERRVRVRIAHVAFGRYWWKAFAALIVVLGGASAQGRFSGQLIAPLRDMGVPMVAGSVLVVVPFLALLAVLIIAMRPSRSAIARVWIDERICPSCLYDLQNLPAQDDGCTRCPECGAAWRLT